MYSKKVFSKRLRVYDIEGIPLTATMPVIGIHSLDASGKVDGLLRVGRASK
jgi:hypothetical protein